MADKKSSTSSLSTILAFGVIIGLVVWAGLVISTNGEERLEQACKPVEYTTQLLHEGVTAVIGRQPTWTLYVQRYLMTGCYYAFSVAFAEGTKGDTIGGGAGVEPAPGGLQE